MARTNLSLSGAAAVAAVLATVWLAPTVAVPGDGEKPLPWVPGSTTIVVLPDTERYSDDYPHLFEAQTRWIRENAARRRIACVIHLGDITQHNAPAEWKVARRAFAMLDGRVPYVLACGNHDYDGPSRGTRVNEHFSVAALRRQSTLGGVFLEGRLENSYHLMRIGRQDWIIVALEFGPRDEVVAWANKILARYGDRPAIVVTHAYLFRDNTRYDHLRGNQRASPHGWGNDGEELWQKLVRRHRNVMLVLSGHVSTGGAAYLASEGDYGNTVHQIMVDYEKLSKGGQAYLRLLELLPDGRTVQVRSYSPALDRYLTDERQQFTLRLKAADRKTPRPADGTPAAALTGAPIHRWKFDGAGGDGARIADAIGRAHGVLTAGGSGSRLSGRGEAILEGNGRVNLPPRLLAGLEDASFEVWFAPTAARYRWQSAVRFGDADDWFGYIFRTLTVHRAEIAVRRHNEDIQRTVPVEPGTSLCVAVTYDHDGADGKPLLCYYRNGKRYGAMATGLELGDVTDSDNGLGPFPGRFDELRLYDRALTPAEVQGSFLAGPDTLRVAPRR